MTKQEIFIKEFKEALEAHPDLFSNEALDYFLELEAKAEKVTAITENGQKILDYMKKAHPACQNRFQAKMIADGLGISSRSVSGSMRKLVLCGYVEKIAENPVIYSLVIDKE